MEYFNILDNFLDGPLHNSTPVTVWPSFEYILDNLMTVALVA